MSDTEWSPLEVLNHLDGVRVFDVRESHEFNGSLGFIASAEVFPLSTIETNFETLTGERPLRRVCRSGKHSEVACENRQEHGVGDILDLPSFRRFLGEL